MYIRAERLKIKFYCLY